MSIPFSKAIIPAVMACAVCAPSLVAAEDAPKPPAASDGAGKAKAPEVKEPKKSFDSPKLTYATFLDAIWRMDQKTALECWDYQADQAKGMTVMVGMWIAHRRLEKAVEAGFNGNVNHQAMEGFLRPEVSNKGLEAAARRLVDAEMTVTGGSAEVDMKWKEYKGADLPFSFPDEALFRHVDGKWKFSTIGKNGSRIIDDRFLAKGSPGRLFLDAMNLMNDAANQIVSGAFKNSGDLVKFLNDGQELISQRYEGDPEIKPEKAE